MFIWTAKLSRKRAVVYVVLAGLAVALLIVGVGLWKQPAEAPPGISTEGVGDNAARVAFLEAYGWAVTPEAVETLRLVLPEQLEDSWSDYNELQTAQGFDLTAYCGKRVERFTYTVTNYPGVQEAVQANLYLCGDTVVAGDIFCAGENGFQAALPYPKDAENQDK